MEGARAEVAAQVPDPRRRFRHLVLGRVLASPALLRLGTVLLRWAQRLHLGALLPRRLARPLRGLRPLSASRTRRGTLRGTGERGTAAVLVGCVSETWFPDVTDTAIELAERAGYRVVVPSRQTCCGALAAHDGAAAAARRLAERNIAAFAGADLVVATAAGCSAHLAGYGHWADGGDDLARRSVDVTILVARLIGEGALPWLGGERGEVAVQDPCHLRHAQREVVAPRHILRAAGYRPVDVDPTGMCCGAAGIYSLRYPATSAELGRRKAREVTATGATVVASANPGCEMQLRQHLPAGYRVVHPIELYLEALLTTRRDEPASL
jgi:glycolate oxidase iron-sulfur subunit